MKITWLTFAAGWVAILGIVPFSGYWTKDRIIEAAFSVGNFGNVPVPWLGWLYGTVAMVGAALTAFYMSRMFFMTFFGKARWTSAAEGAPVNPRESGPMMTIPLILLAIPSLFMGGLLAGGRFVTWLEPTVGPVQHGEPVLPVIAIETGTTVLVVAAAALAWYLFVKRPVPIGVPAAGSLVMAARDDFYQDRFNEAVFMAPSVAIMKGVTASDKYGIDGAVTGLARLTGWVGKVVVWTETGYVRAYAGYILGGVVIALAVVLGFRL